MASERHGVAHGENALCGVTMMTDSRENCRLVAAMSSEKLIGERRVLETHFSGVIAHGAAPGTVHSSAMDCLKSTLWARSSSCGVPAVPQRIAHRSRAAGCVPQTVQNSRCVFCEPAGFSFPAYLIPVGRGEQHQRAVLLLGSSSALMVSDSSAHFRTIQLGENGVLVSPPVHVVRRPGNSPVITDPTHRAPEVQRKRARNSPVLIPAYSVALAVYQPTPNGDLFFVALSPPHAKQDGPPLRYPAKTPRFARWMCGPVQSLINDA